MKLDAHQHFWKYNESDYAWISDELSVLKRNFLPDDLAEELQKQGLDGCIAVQARQSVEETKWLLSLANAHDIIKGVVGWVDLRSATVLQDIKQLAQNPKLVGMRHVLQDEEDLSFILEPAFMNGIQALQDNGLTYDLLVFEHQLPMVSQLVKQFPDMKFVLDHIAKPKIKDKTLQPWKDHLLHLAQYKNVSCKLSGMLTEADWNNWTITDFEPYLQQVFACFGADRLMFGSDWPVCKLAGEYSDALNVVSQHLKKYSKTAQAKVMGINCEQFYLNK
ncbi:amidohydrolase family protein [Saccharicrinis aurantiacus]|uniref:amidohydrolase family protein n=1 Tax=Saccharicrinis aurantiacus TaxID=1849719 RepID=UPI0008398C15|nr:amidohydrolase family protein [Saccharicrinis aurantiacus]